MEAKMHYIKAWQSLPEYGISLFVINFMGHKKEELLGVAFNRLMRMDINTGDHLRTWRYNSMIVSLPKKKKLSIRQKVWVRQEILFSKKFYSTRNFVWQIILLDKKFCLAKNYTRQEILFGKKFYSTRNFVWQKILLDKKFCLAKNFTRQEISFEEFSTRNFS